MRFLLTREANLSFFLTLSLVLVFAQSAWADDSYCFLSGAFNRRAGSLGDAQGGIVRMRYDASTKEDCIELTKAICHKNKDSGLTPDGLVLTFRKSSSADENTLQYTFSKDCEIKIRK